ncbi:substrate-binding domain-containing protein [Microbacterium sp. BWT-B31]|uniref:substrate-binding domain-containing protein n=1 Tax=Microbacterium sp. BWT-B31 TaxID=3232072 RepID=UPI0035283BD7
MNTRRKDAGQRGPQMREPLRIGLAIPLQGPAGIFGPSCETAALLAAAQLNEHDGILDREVVIEVIDAGGSPQQTRRNVIAALRSGRAHAIAGWHLSSVREDLAPMLADYDVPYVYTSLHEGAHTPGVLAVGETPSRQIAPGLDWLHREFGIRRWAVVGSDYIWPRNTARAMREHAKENGDLEIAHESFVGYGVRDFSHVIEALSASHAQGVVMLLVGRDAVLFNRQFAASGLDERMIRFTPLMEENMLLASGGEATRELYVAAAYFRNLTTQAALDLAGAYGAGFGSDAPVLNNAGESCYEGLYALAAAANKAQSLDSRAMLEGLEHGISYEGPRGPVVLTAAGADQQVHLARADRLEFEVLARL